MGLVIATIIITAGYIGYHASQETEEAEKHDIAVVIPETLEVAQPIQTLEGIAVAARL